jgi:hypothetical protein
MAIQEKYSRQPGRARDFLIPLSALLSKQKNLVPNLMPISPAKA